MHETKIVDGSNLVDRRAHPRFKVNYLTEVYMGSEILFATVIDISEGGVGIMLPAKFYTGEVLNLRIKCSLFNYIANIEVEEVNICLTAEVIWINKNENMYRAGLKIVDIDNLDLDRLKDNIRVLQTGSRQ